MPSSDTAALRSILAKTDGSAPSIKNAAGAMMKHYDRSADVAVSAWRDALLTSQPHQLLPLLYVANEVLQNSKRNRGKKFLEAFSPVLGQSLVTICQRSDAETVEKVRRTTKIWGDRQVFSVRYVSELLRGLEMYRNKDNEPSPQANFSPIHEKRTSPKQQEPEPTPVSDVPVSATSKTVETDSDDDLLGFAGIGDSLGDSEEQGLGHLDIDFSAAASASLNNSASTSLTKKRKRTSSVARRKSVLSTTSLMELWNQVESLQEGMEYSQNAVRDIDDKLKKPLDVEQLVGDELLDQYKSLMEQQQKLQKERRALHGIARARRSLEQDAVRYIPWLQKALIQDDEDMKFCSDLLRRLQDIKFVHGEAKAARDERRKQEAEHRAKEEQEARKQKEEEERRHLLESAMKTEKEAKPGMVWNKATQEYVYLNTDESWRD